MTKKLAFWIFLAGTISSSALFLWLTLDTHRQVEVLANVDKLSERVVAGKRVFEKYNCNDCHTILGFGGYYAPDLTKVIRRIGEGGVQLIVKMPDKTFAGSRRKMPNQGLSDEEIGRLIAFFTWIGNIDNGDWPPQDSATRLSRKERRIVASTALSPGAAVFKAQGCMHCHALQKRGGTAGPPLDGIARRRSPKEIMHSVVNHADVDQDAAMKPRKDLSGTEVEAVTLFLANLK
ncbi:MAG TPA: cytochrome C [Nitrospiraceae bacterium]|nr:cytochrome C [Nitrospiraceae bacterium]